MIEGNEYRALKANAGDDPLHPPTTGWLFKNWARDEFEEDKSLTCAPLDTSSPPCCVTVHLSGHAREAVGQCEGVYHTTELICRGRKVRGDDIV